MTVSLKLYVAGKTGASVRAEKNLRALVAELDTQVAIEVIDIQRQPALALQNRIVATPALVVASPLPRRKVIGDLSDRETVLSFLGIARGTKNR